MAAPGHQPGEIDHLTHFVAATSPQFSPMASIRKGSSGSSSSTKSVTSPLSPYSVPSAMVRAAMSSGGEVPTPVALSQPSSLE